MEHETWLLLTFRWEINITPRIFLIEGAINMDVAKNRDILTRGLHSVRVFVLFALTDVGFGPKLQTKLLSLISFTAQRSYYYPPPPPNIIFAGPQIFLVYILHQI